MAPVILLLAIYAGHESRALIVVLIYLGLLSDILDGIVARRQNCSTSTLRRLDSQTDMVFWLSAGFAAWVLFPSVIQAHSIAIWVILGMELACYLLSIARFGRETCTHAFLSKLWGLSLLAAFTSLIGFGHAGAPFMTAIVLGLVSHADRMLITLLLPRWHHDVPSAYHAWLIRKGKSFRRNRFLNG